MQLKVNASPCIKLMSAKARSARLKGSGTPIKAIIRGLLVHKCIVGWIMLEGLCLPLYSTHLEYGWMLMLLSWLRHHTFVANLVPVER